MRFRKTIRKVAKKCEVERGKHDAETRLTKGYSGDPAARWMVVRDGVDPSTSGFSDRFPLGLMTSGFLEKLVSTRSFDLA